MKTLLLFVFMATCSMAQSIRPDQLDSLRTWVKADSLGKSFSDEASVDSMYDWGSTGSAFVAGTSPKFDINQSPTGLPGVRFGLSTSNLVKNNSAASYKFLHDGTPYTLIMVFRINSIGVVHTLFRTAATITGASYGTQVYINTNNQMVHMISKASSGNFLINNITTNVFDETSSVQFIVVTYDTDGDPDDIIRMNGEQQTTANVTNLPHGTSNADNGRFGTNSASSTNFHLYEFILYKGKKTNDEISSLLWDEPNIDGYEGLYKKWTGTRFPGTPRNLDTSYVHPHEVALHWNPEDSSTGGYKVYRQNDPSHITYPTYVNMETTTDENDTTFVESLRLPGTIHKYKVRAWNDTLVTNHSNIVAVTFPEPDVSGLDGIECYVQTKWLDVACPGVDAAMPGLIRRRGENRRGE